MLFTSDTTHFAFCSNYTPKSLYFHNKLLYLISFTEKLSKDNSFSTCTKFSDKPNVKYDTFKTKIDLFLFKEKQVDLAFKRVIFNS